MRRFATKHRLALLLTGGLCVLTLAAFSLFPENKPVDERAYVPAEQVTAALETATAEKNGPIGGIAIETEDNGSTLVEVIVRDASGTPYTVEVNANTDEVEEVEEGIEEHHELEEEGEEYEEHEENDEHGGSP